MCFQAFEAVFLIRGESARISIWARGTGERPTQRGRIYDCNRISAHQNLETVLRSGAVHICGLQVARGTARILHECESVRLLKEQAAADPQSVFGIDSVRRRADHSLQWRDRLVRVLARVSGGA